VSEQKRKDGEQIQRGAQATKSMASISGEEAADRGRSRRVGAGSSRRRCGRSGSGWSGCRPRRSSDRARRGAGGNTRRGTGDGMGRRGLTTAASCREHHRGLSHYWRGI
jgi:hypothetical protein